MLVLGPDCGLKACQPGNHSTALQRSLDLSLPFGRVRCTYTHDGVPTHMLGNSRAVAFDSYSSGIDMDTN